MNAEASRKKSAWHCRALRCLDTTLSRLPGDAPRIVVLGFWRSGTTSVMEQISARTGLRSFFEPLHFSVPQAAAMHPSMVFEVNGRTVTQWIPFRHPDEPSEELRQLLSAALGGSISTPWTQRKRRLQQSLARGTVVKFVRANLLGAWIQRTFGVRPIWVVRHPGAVLASIVRPSGGTPAIRASLGDPRLLEWVLQQDGVLRHWQELSEVSRGWGPSSSEEDNILKLWAVTHWIPWRLAEAGAWTPVLLPYHRIVSDSDALPAVLRALGVDVRNSDRDGRPGDSSTTKEGRRGMSVQARIHGWRQELPDKTQEDLKRIVRSFGQGFEDWIDASAI